MREKQPKTKHEKQPPFWASLIAGGWAGAVSRTATAPLDRVKILVQEGRIIDYAIHHPTVQVRPDAHKKQIRMRKVLRHIYREGGIPAFWRGNGANCMKAGPEFALVFSLRSRFAAYLDRCWSWVEEEERGGSRKPSLFFRCVAYTVASLPAWASNIIVGALAGGIAQTVLYPLELIKTRIAVSAPGEYSSIADCIQQSYRRNGIREFYKGLSANLVGIIPYRGLEVGMFFTFRQSILTHRAAKQAKEQAEFDRSKRHKYDPDLPPPKLSATEIAMLGTGSGIVAQTVTYPLNLVRTRLQTQGVNGRPVLYDGMVDCFATILKSEGPRGLFHGLSANYMKAVPASAVTFVVFDSVQQTLSGFRLQHH